MGENRFGVLGFRKLKKPSAFCWKAHSRGTWHGFPIKAAPSVSSREASVVSVRCFDFPKGGDCSPCFWQRTAWLFPLVTNIEHFLNALFIGHFFQDVDFDMVSVLRLLLILLLRALDVSTGILHVAEKMSKDFSPTIWAVVSFFTLWQCPLEHKRCSYWWSPVSSFTLLFLDYFFILLLDRDRVKLREGES